MGAADLDAAAFVWQRPLGGHAVKRYRLVTVHGERNTIFCVVDTRAVVDSYSTAHFPQAYDRAVRRCEVRNQRED
jgi:hypothetical protein